MEQMFHRIDDWLGVELDWTLWKLWLLRTSIGAVVGGAVGWFITDAASAYALSAPLMGLSVGAGIGIAQWMALRGYVSWVATRVVENKRGGRRVDQWVLVTAVGTGFAYLVGADNWWMGIIVGLAQWLVLTKYYKKAWWWVLASAVGWGLAFQLGAGVLRASLGFDSTGTLTIFIVWALVNLVSGLAVGSVSVVALAWLIKTNAATAPVGSAEPVTQGGTVPRQVHDTQSE